jgi:hypothetical protein
MKKTIIILLGAAIGIGGSFALRQILTKTPAPMGTKVDPAGKQKRKDEQQRKIAWKNVKPRIEIAQEEALKAVETRTQEVRDFFAERQKRVPAYAERVLSFRSKWELGKSKIPGADKDAHTRFLREEFSKIVFSQAELGQVVTSATEDYVRDVQAIENALLVNIHAARFENGGAFPRSLCESRGGIFGKDRDRRQGGRGTACGQRNCDGDYNTRRHCGSCAAWRLHNNSRNRRRGQY